MSDTVAELQSDIQELKSLIAQATRPNNKALFSTQLSKLEAEVTKLTAPKPAPAPAMTPATTTSAPLTGYTKKINTYGWDQSDKFVKIYITSLPDINKVTAENVACNFTEKSFDLIIKNLNNVNYNLVVKNLLHLIDPKESTVKVKSDMITVMMRKKEANKWDCVTGIEMLLKEKPKPKIGENTDPQESLMSLMKQMYDEGDDEMKRTIGKAFSESRDKQMKGEMA